MEKRLNIGGHLLLGGVVLALSAPLGVVAAHEITPILWRLEEDIHMTLTSKSEPLWFVTLLSITLVWTVLFIATGMTIEHRRARR